MSTPRPTGTGPTDLLTLAELARYLGVADARAAEWAVRHKLALPGAPGARRFLVADVVHVLRQGGAVVQEQPARVGLRPRAQLG